MTSKGRDNLYTFRKGNFLKFIRKYNLSGDGTEVNPYIIPVEVSLPENLYVKNVKLFLLFEGYHFTSLTFRWCRNITFRNCSFNFLAVYQTNDLKFYSCSITHLNLSGAAFNLFEDCRIENVANLSSAGNIFKSTTLDENTVQGALMGKLDLGVFVKLINYLLIFLLVSLLSTLAISLLGSLDWGYVIAVGIGLVLFIVVRQLLMRASKSSQEIGPNQIIQ